MKVLFDFHLPFAFAHGGLQIQIEQTKAGLDAIGIETDFLRWWDDQQRADIVHFFGRPHPCYSELAKKRGFRVVLSDLLSAQGSRPPWMHLAHGLVLRTLETLLPHSFSLGLTSQSYRYVDAAIANTPWEASLMQKMYGADPKKVFVAPNGVEQVFFQQKPYSSRGEWLVCTATITERKRVLELAEAAVKAQTPVWILGKPYSEAEEYFRRFKELAARHPKLIRYEGAVSDRTALAQIYGQARGFVLLSTMETRSLSSEEAAATGCPLLLSDLPWARSTFGDHARYIPITRAEETAAHLRRFYDEATSLAAPPPPMTWPQVAEVFRSVYDKVLRGET